MSAIEIGPGYTFIKPSGPPDNPHVPHVFVVLTRPFSAPGFSDSVVTVPITKAPKVMSRGKASFDETCLLSVGCHPLITDPSYAYYLLAQIECAYTIQTRAHTIWRRQEFLDPNSKIFKDIARGLLVSDHVQPIVQSFYLDANCKT